MIKLVRVIIFLQFDFPELPWTHNHQRKVSPKTAVQFRIRSWA